MIRIYAEVVFAAVLIAFLAVSGVHSFNVSEQERADDMSINRYGED